jgi:hypothetical protein
MCPLATQPSTCCPPLGCTRLPADPGVHGCPAGASQLHSSSTQGPRSRQDLVLSHPSQTGSCHLAQDGMVPSTRLLFILATAQQLSQPPTHPSPESQKPPWVLKRLPVLKGHTLLMGLYGFIGLNDTSDPALGCGIHLSV